MPLVEGNEYHLLAKKRKTQKSRDNKLEAKKNKKKQYRATLNMPTIRASI